MNVTDPIADMLTRIRNASAARHRELSLPSSRVKREIARILADEGFIESYETRTDPDAVQDQLVLRLKYVEGKTPVVTGLKRISKPGLRVYARKTEIPRVLGGLGLAILSTSHGIMTGSDARKQNLGGEVLCYVW
jgi:small subunit ribosomal protein S8